jgi:hypothetical protein
MNEIHELPPITRADEVIERFGGIRPMATKVGVPVTTVQGWKKRNVIPGNRRDDILAAANKHNVPVLDLMAVHIAPAPASAAKNTYGTDKKPAAAAPSARPASAQTGTAPRPLPQHPAPGASRTATNIAIAVSLLLIAVICYGLTMVGPRVKQMNANEERIAQLEAQLAAVQQQAPQQTDPAQMAALQEQNAGMQERLATLSNDLRTINEGAMPERLAKMEEMLGKYMQTSGNSALTGFWAKVQGMQADPASQSSLQNVMASLQAQLPNMTNPTQAADGTQVPGMSVDQALVNLRAQDPAINQTFAGVPDQDMKAAVVLLGFSSLRENLRRDNESFGTDLALLEKVVGKDDPALHEALNRLAPKAQEGVLTPSGLGNEFRTVAGDIVVASLSGEDISVEEKAKAALHNVMRVEKDGQALTGTPTQMAVTQAQKQLDSGDIDGAIATLEQLQGPAAEKAQPFIQDARSTQLAGQVQQLLTGNILGRLGLGGMAGMALNAAQGGVNGGMPGNLPQVVTGGAGMPTDMQGIANMVGKAGQSVGGGVANVVTGTIGGGQVVEDPASGVKVYRNNFDIPGQIQRLTQPTRPSAPLGLQDVTVPAQPQPQPDAAAPAAEAPAAGPPTGTPAQGAAQ